MSITGWRVHFIRRGLARPREVTPFKREFSEFLAVLAQGLDALGVPEGQQLFLISLAGVCDAALNRYFSVRLASSPWNTQAAHARKPRTYFEFLWFARGQRDWRGASVDERAVYEWWRRDERGPHLEDTSSDREMSTVNQFYLWAIEQDLVRASRAAAALTAARRRGWQPTFS
ncbi:hypothetical protein ACFV16_34700 [Streptomyces massasporeus]|uniref:hypothetical protein n=1 Tax=Streptomyces massasporeus TaxID=67324 RepID=UPI00368E11D1